ncbi:hypothetical protein KJ762_05690 [bacterium]|nr:hypothetical protein [bacterium]MBU1633987.1 hypothetical protein [bacterium]MBU1874217.1 hypothetical protein [bacterium]
MVKFKIGTVFGLICVFILSISDRVYSQTMDSVSIDWTHPENIDPLQYDITSFLNVQWQGYDQIGLHHLQQGNYLDAARYFIASLRFNADNITTLYNLACCYSRLGYTDLAINYLKKAHEAGYSDYSNSLMDTDFVNIRNDADFINCMEEIQNTIQNTGKVLYVEGSKLIPCRVHIPPDFDPNIAYPLLIGLHGYTGNAESMSRLWRLFKKQNFIFVCPEAPYSVLGSTGNTEGRYSWEPRIPNLSLWKRADPLVEYINNVRKYITSVFKINEVFLLGFSQGAGYTYVTGIKNPDDYAGIICFAGSLPISDKSSSMLSEIDIENGKSLPVFIAHGMNDGAISYDIGAKSRDYLEEHGYDVTFRDFVAGHIIETTVLHKAEKWMLAIAEK